MFRFKLPKYPKTIFLFALMILLVLDPFGILLKSGYSQTSTENIVIEEHIFSDPGQFNPIDVEVRIENIEGVTVGDAQVRTFSEEWGIFYPS